ncbi:MAG: S41 family peptidase [Bacteroidales bacterium]|nr:S41 family peptidase [Bacteroidales bacterium]
MDWNRHYTWLSTLLGVIIGALIVVNVYTLIRIRKDRKALQDQGWRKMELVMQSLSDNYVDTIDYKSVTEATLQTLFHQLDPHSVYLPPAELTESETDLAGNFEGIGIQFNVPNDTAIVLEVIPGGPSEKIGLRQGDRILRVDDKDIAGVKFPQDSMVRRMKGPAGTKVTITVRRGHEVIPFEITRGKIPVHSIDASFMVDDTTGYIRLSKFSRTTATEFLTSSAELLAKGMKKLVFDLRDNTGGYFDQALVLSNLFLNKGDNIVYMEGLHRKRSSYRADGRGFLRDVQLVVLINENSASSSEIFAGAIQDNDRGVIVGRRSFGKGLVQEPLYFSDGSGVRLTVARFYTPSGRCIQKPYDEGDEKYAYDIYNRYMDGEMLAADSIKVNKDLEYHTKGGRPVYGGGGIIPDVFVPLDTTRATRFYLDCTRKATSMRFASEWFDSHREELTSIEEYPALINYLDKAGLDRAFLKFAASKDNIRPSGNEEWKQSATYMMPQVRALVGRYSKQGENAFYHLYMDVDETLHAALKAEPLSLSAGQ